MDRVHFHSTPYDCVFRCCRHWAGPRYDVLICVCHCYQMLSYYRMLFIIDIERLII